MLFRGELQLVLRVLYLVVLSSYEQGFDNQVRDSERDSHVKHEPLAQRDSLRDRWERLNLRHVRKVAAFHNEGNPICEAVVDLKHQDRLTLAIVVEEVDSPEGVTEVISGGLCLHHEVS